MLFMKTYNVQIEGKDMEVIPVGQAWAYALKGELEAIKDISVDEDEFLSFLDQRFNEIGDALVEAWEDWKGEQEEDEN